MHVLLYPISALTTTSKPLMQPKAPHSSEKAISNHPQIYSVTIAQIHHAPPGIQKLLLPLANFIGMILHLLSRPHLQTRLLFNHSASCIILNRLTQVASNIPCYQ